MPRRSMKRGVKGNVVTKKPADKFQIKAVKTGKSMLSKAMGKLSKKK